MLDVAQGSALDGAFQEKNVLKENRLVFPHIPLGGSLWPTLWGWRLSSVCPFPSSRFEVRNCIQFML